MSIYSIIKPIYKKYVPKSVRSSIANSNSLLGQCTKPLRTLVESLAKHDEIYDKQYFAEHVDPSIQRSVVSIGDSIVREFSPRQVIDVGCGTGSLLCELQSRDIGGVGLEYAQAAIDLARSRQVDVRKFDLENEVCDLGPVDLVISMEVAEHLPEASADRYVELLTKVSDNVLMTAAIPGQGGTDHVNEQPNEYWIASFCGGKLN